MNKITLYHGDVLDVLKRLPSDSVHCVVTSPPYWGLRDYGVDGQIGLEDSFDAWLAKMVAVFAEIKRVLHPSGTVWCNMGDSYNSAMTRGTFGDLGAHNRGYEDHGVARPVIKRLHPKNLIGQPWKLAFALQDDGWILRSDIVWHKPNPMPESVTDRPSRGHEFIHLFSRKAIYFYDNDAIRERTGREATEEEDRAARETTRSSPGKNAHRGSLKTQPCITHPLGRAKRSVWTISTEAQPEAHFATFPKKLVEPCLKAGTSEKGCCPKCLTPWTRTYEKVGTSQHGGKRKRADAPGAEVSPTSVFNTGEIAIKQPTGWEAGCKCDAGEPIPCTVLDPFNGSGTTGLVAARLQRHYIGIDLNPEYIEMARRRISNDQPLFNQVEVVA